MGCQKPGNINFCSDCEMIQIPRPPSRRFQYTAIRFPSDEGMGEKIQLGLGGLETSRFSWPVSGLRS
jgi:hypothetical protein